MSSTIYIDGTDRTGSVVRESVAIRREASFKNSELSFQMRNFTTLPAEGNVVEFYDSGTLTFSGKIATVHNDSLLPEKTVEVTCVDWYDELMGELVRTTYEDKTLKEIVQDILATRVLPDDLKVMLQFEEGSGTTADDSTDYDNPGTLVGAGVTWDTSNYALDFSGSAGNYLKVADDADVDFTSDFSVCVEFIADSLNQTILQKENGSDNTPYRIQVNSSGYVAFRVSTGAATSFDLTMDSNALSAGTRYAVTCTFSQTTGLGKIYVNGVLRKSGTLTTSTLLNSSGDLVIGASSGTSFDGKVYRFSGYSKELSAIEARRWYLDILEVKAPQRFMAAYGTNITSAVFAYEHPADCFSTLARELGLAWRIDEQMFVRFFDLAGGTPSLTIDEDDGQSVIQGSLAVEKDLTQVRNSVYVRGGVYGASWQQDTLKANGTDTVFALPYKYEHFEMFTDTLSLCADIRSWWKMEEGSGSLTDQKGNNNLTAANLTYAQAGKLGNSIDFNGTTSSARKTSASHVTGNTKHAMTAWVKPDVHDTTQRYVLGFGDFAGNRSTLSLIKVSSTYYLRHEFSGSVVNDVSVGDLSGAWHLLGMSYNPDHEDGKQLKLYADGVLKTTVLLTSAPNVTAGVVEMGGKNGSNVFDGKIDECHLLNYALSDQEHLALYKMGDAAGVSAALLHTGTEFLDTSGFDAYYNYTEKNYKFATAPSNGVVFYPTGQPQLPVQTVRSNTASVALYGRRELEVNDSTIESLVTARQLASAELSRRKDPVTRITFATYRTGIDPGSVLSVTLPSYGVATGSYFVQRVDTVYSLPVLTNSKQHLYRVECVNVMSKDWLDFLRDMFRQKKRRIDPAEAQAVGDLQDHSEDATVAEVWTVATPETHAEDVTVDDAHSLVSVTSGAYKWSNDALTTTDKLRWELGDWG